MSATTFTESPSCVKRTVPRHLLPAVACNTATACLTAAQVSPCSCSAERNGAVEVKQHAETAAITANGFHVFIDFPVNDSEWFWLVTTSYTSTACAARARAICRQRCH